ncbi:MAG TPA: hypothetical protein VFF68_03045 [Anaerolineaceae bacterium]|nr:hypothetical protein [Anaerolineaceae bacterium]
MSIIQSLKTYLKTCPSLADGALLEVDHNGPPIQYGIIPVPGARVVETYVNGGSLREFPFAFQTAAITADDAERIDNAGFQEAFADWLDIQTLAGNLPDLGAGKTAESIAATSWGYLFEQGESDTGIYQILCKLTYEQAP